MPRLDTQLLKLQHRNGRNVKPLLVNAHNIPIQYRPMCLPSTLACPQNHRRQIRFGHVPWMATEHGDGGSSFIRMRLQFLPRGCRCCCVGLRLDSSEGIKSTKPTTTRWMIVFSLGAQHNNYCPEGVDNNLGMVNCYSFRERIFFLMDMKKEKKAR